jgi:hypothetical protein
MLDLFRGAATPLSQGINIVEYKFIRISTIEIAAPTVLGLVALEVSCILQEESIDTHEFGRRRDYPFSAGKKKSANR